MHLNADAEREALAPFVLTIGGQTHTARPISWPAYREATEAAVRLQAGEIGVRAFDAALRSALRSAFPFRWHYLWRPLSRDPVNLILLETPVIRQRILDDFFAWARHGLPSPASPTGGTSTPSPSSAGGTP